MKKILVRAGFNPQVNYTPHDFLTRNLVGDNVGNLMFAYGVMNVLWTEDTQVDQVYDKSFSEKEAQQINEHYDCLVLPMADAFRDGFVWQLKAWTHLIKRLSIPVVVIGIGLRTTYEPELSRDFVFDEVAKDFVRAVLDHSSLLGLRGEITGKYLGKLGFTEDRDYVPIGCPSLYTYGEDVVMKRILPKEDLFKGKCIFNLNTWAISHYEDVVSTINSFIIEETRKFPDHYLIQQKIHEFKDMYLGKFQRGLKQTYIQGTNNADELKRLHIENRVKVFLNVASWIRFCRDADFFIGNRFHGSVAAILAGCPHVFLPFDGRTRELTEYHSITHLTPAEIKGGKSILDYYDILDFHSFEKRHKNNFENYLGFLAKNGLDSYHIFKEQKNFEMGTSPMERAMKFDEKPIACIDSLPSIDKIQRVLSVYSFKIENKIKKRIKFSPE